MLPLNIMPFSFLEKIIGANIRNANHGTPKIIARNFTALTNLDCNLVTLPNNYLIITYPDFPVNL